MSSTNRGSKRKDKDFYVTPQWCIEAFLSNHPLKGKYILEPCAGNGGISKAIKKFYPISQLSQVEIRPEEEKNLKQYGYVIIGDFLKCCYTIPHYNHFDTIITNPPFSIAQEIIEKCFELKGQDTEIIMLLRMGFLGSKKRKDFWQQHPFNKLYILAKRPSFTGSRTDSEVYGWFVWDGSDKQEVKWI